MNDRLFAIRQQRMLPMGRWEIKSLGGWPRACMRAIKVIGAPSTAIIDGILDSVQHGRLSLIAMRAQ
jgi:hypothetical protein